jgi:DNA transformation protein
MPKNSKNIASEGGARTRKNIGLNLGPKTTNELASIGIKTMDHLKAKGWTSVFLSLIEKFPDRLNLNMAAGLIGAVLDVHWQDIPESEKKKAKDLIKSLKPKKPKSKPKSSPKADQSFVDYIVLDQLPTLNIDARRMFGGYGLYHRGKFFGIIHDGCLYLKTDDHTRVKYLEEGMGPFSPNAKQTLKSYYQVPIHVLEDSRALTDWVQDAIQVSA